MAGPAGRTWYQVVQGPDSSGFPLVVLHGGPGAPHDYLQPLADLADRRPVIFYDQLGCGRSDRPSDFTGSIDYFVAELHQLLDTLGLPRVHLLGQSWGTMLAVAYLLTHGSDRVGRLVLSGPYLSTAVFMADQETHLAAMPAAERDAIARCEATGDFSDPAYEAAMAMFYRRHVCRMQPWPKCLLDTLENLGEAVYNGMWGPSEFTMTGTLRDADLTPELPRLHLPVLLTCGEYDEVTPATTAHYASLLPNSRVLVLPDASHNHHLESPTLYLAAVREFLG